MNKKIAIASTILLASIFQQTTQAQEPRNSGQVPNETNLTATDSKSATNTWLELQPSGSKASMLPQTLSGPVMQNVYDRYKESFSRPIPQMTEQDARKIK
jgi:hypothetical protein